MVGLLRKFIKEELAWNYWVRRPRNSLVRDVGSEIADKRRVEFDPAAQDFLQGAKELSYDIEQANSIDELEDIVFGWGVSADEVIADYTEFERYIESGDIKNVKRMLLQGVEHWKRQMIGNAVGNGMDYAALDAWTPDGTGVGERLGEAYPSRENQINAFHAINKEMVSKRGKKIREKTILMWTTIDRGTVKSRKGTTYNRRLLRAIPINMEGKPLAWVFENEFIHDSDLKVLLSAIKKSPTIKGNSIRLQKLAPEVFTRLIYDVIDEKFDKIKNDYIESFQGALSIAEPESRGALSPVTGADSGLAIIDDE